MNCIMPKTCTSQKQETREIWISIFNFYSTCFCLFCNCLISAHAVGRWNWWQPFNTISLQCPGQPLSYAGGHWRDNSPGSYEGDILNLIPSLRNFLLCEVILFVTDLLFNLFLNIFNLHISRSEQKLAIEVWFLYCVHVSNKQLSCFSTG